MTTESGWGGPASKVLFTPIGLYGGSGQKPWRAMLRHGRRADVLDMGFASDRSRQRRGSEGFRPAGTSSGAGSLSLFCSKGRVDAGAQFVPWGYDCTYWPGIGPGSRPVLSVGVWLASRDSLYVEGAGLHVSQQ